MNWIRRFKIVKMSSAPMYGRDIVLATYSDLTTAIQQAKRMPANHSYIGVIEFRYASEENLAKDFSFDSRVVWGSWLNKE